MKYINKFNEGYGIEYLKSIALITNGRQHDYYQWQCNLAKEISISDIPNNIIIGKAEKKQCFKNTFKVVDNNYGKDILYVEGLVMISNIPIDHAWNKIGDVYFDVTANLFDIKYDEYISIIELSEDKMWKYANKTGIYGSFLSSAFIDGYKK